MCVLKVKVISLPYIFQVLYVLCFTRPRFQVSVYRTTGPLVYFGRIRTLVAMAIYSFHGLIMGKVEIGNLNRLIGDNRILFLQKCLLNSSPHFIRLLLELLNLIGCQGNINS